MDLSRVLLKQFAKLTNDSSANSKSASTIRGTAVVDGDKKYVQLDGSSLLTPISEAADIQNGDRVLVSIENHTATVIGNYTCPASARTASNFLKLMEEGLLVGNLDENGNPKGLGSLIAPGTYYVVDEDGNALASFAPDSIDIGTLEAIVRFCGGKCRIYSSDGVMVLYANNAVGMRSAYANTTDTYRAEVVCQAKDNKPAVSIQAYGTKDSDPCHISLTRDGIALVGPVVTCNGSEVLRSNKLLASGTIIATGSINAGKSATIQAEITNMPTGYHLVGIREVSPNYSNDCVITRLYTHPSGNVVGAKLKNISTKNLTDVEVYIEWFALYTRGSTYTIDDVITFTEDE